MAVLFTGGLVYLVLEEKYNRKHKKAEPVSTLTDEELAIFREVEDALSGPDSLHANLQSIIAGAKGLQGSFKEMVEEDKQTLQRSKDTFDELALAAGRPDLAFDPLSAEFRLAIERKKPND
jgi:hypothetical protein